MYSKTWYPWSSPLFVQEERWYEYDARGRASYVTRRFADDPWLRGTRLYYDSREHLWLAIAEKWQVDGLGNPMNCQRTSAMEYRYDEGRAMYMVRPRNAQTLGVDDTMSGMWHDYDGADIYGDYAVNGTAQAPAATQTMAHAPGMAQYDPLGGTGVPPVGAASYLHGNLIGTNELMTGPGATVERRAAYTAFGERVYLSGTADSRYGYAGEWGYQEAKGTDPLAELGWLHVGERYYDPSSGRFVQRDPIGIRGGSNTYSYVLNTPTAAIDAAGLLGGWTTGGGNQGIGQIRDRIDHEKPKDYRDVYKRLPPGWPAPPPAKPFNWNEVGKGVACVGLGEVAVGYVLVLIPPLAPAGVILITVGTETIVVGGGIVAVTQ